MTEKEADEIVAHYYEDPELQETISRMMKDSEDAMEFMLFYGWWPEPGEVEATRKECVAQWAEHDAAKAVRPGLKKMLRYWL